MVCLVLSGCVRWIGGNFTHKPEDAARLLSPAARALISVAFQDLPPSARRDFHTHLLTLGHGGNGGYVNPRMLTWRHPIRRFKTTLYMSASGVDDLDQADTQYLERLVRLIRAVPGRGRHYLLAFDQHYTPDGSPNSRLSHFYVPNDYVYSIATRYSDLFIPVVSIHPYRADALEELERWARSGVKLIKWLPNSQGVDPSEPRLDVYYTRVRELGMSILTHVGEEQAVESQRQQKLGNPLRLRRALDCGVRIIMAHCGSLGTDEDLDHPARHQVPSYELVLRLLREPKYRGLLYADISAMTQFHRLPEPLLAILEAEDVHGQLVDGSDYPLPGLNALIRLGKLVRYGLLAAEDVKPLREIYGFNPLLFDFVLKRRLRHPQTGRGIPVSVFLAKSEFAD
ncbi:MAG: amidohydrolase family protein [Verrucomicrobia bacterium]|nr:amidohydrolase family protein [Verrucomicrobiota bacterium]